MVLYFLCQASKGRFKEDEARKYFQQLINAVDYCHSRGVFHRDLKVWFLIVVFTILLPFNVLIKLILMFFLLELNNAVGGDELICMYFWMLLHLFQEKEMMLLWFVISQPENLLLDASGVLKVSDFGLSALPQQVRVSIMT